MLTRIEREREDAMSRYVRQFGKRGGAVMLSGASRYAGGLLVQTFARTVAWQRSEGGASRALARAA